jgi:hypothetical protein
MALDPDEGRLDYFIPRLVGLQVQYETFFFFSSSQAKTDNWSLGRLDVRGFVWREYRCKLVAQRSVVTSNL